MGACQERRIALTCVSVDPETAPDLFFLDDAEGSLIVAAIDEVAAVDPEHAAGLREFLVRLARSADLVRVSPSLASSLKSRQRGAFSEETLVDALCRVPEYDVELHVPTKVVFGQAYLIAKINFFKAIGYALETLSAGALYDRVQDEIGQSIYSKLAEELFLAIATDVHGTPDVRHRAARALYDIWENRLTAEIDDFAPVLESIWQARNQVRPVLGTMRGTQEFFRLVQARCDPRFVDYFAGDGVGDEERQAFEEFLFGIAHEEIEKLREHLDEDGRGVVSVEEAKTVLGRTGDSWLPSSGPQSLYTSYKRRKVKATYRHLTDSPGPKKTAEEYVTIALLLRGAKL